MTATTPSTAVVTVQPVFTDSERLPLAGFLAGYRGLAREAYTLDLRQFTAGCGTGAPHIYLNAEIYISETRILTRWQCCR